MKYYYTYKITLLKGSLAGKYYYGQHTTSNLNDGYAGSGRKVKDYYNKYGKIEHQTYIKEIITFYNNREELNQGEYELIGDKYDSDVMCLNLCAGGNQCGISEEMKQKISETKKGQVSWNKGKHHTEQTRKKISENLHGKNAGCKHPMYGKHHTEQTRKNMSETRKGRVPWNKHKTGIYSEEVRQKMSDANKGKEPGNKGKHKVWDDETHTKFHYEF